jgi:hypothetical protein
MTDLGEPGKNDMIAITLWNSSGGLWFASDWDGTKTAEKVLGGGNVVVHGASNSIGTIPTTVTVTSPTHSTGSSTTGQSVTFKAVINETNSATPTGNVLFYDGAIFIVKVPVSTVSGVTSASLTTSALVLGSHNIIAYYSGDSKFAESSGNLAHTVNDAAPITTIGQNKIMSQEEQVIPLEFSIKAYPNPTDHFFTLNVEGNKNEKVKLKVLDISGKTVYVTEGSANRTYRFGDTFINGVYIVEVMQADKRKTIKLIKQQ